MFQKTVQAIKGLFMTGDYRASLLSTTQKINSKQHVLTRLDHARNELAELHKHSWEFLPDSPEFNANRKEVARLRDEIADLESRLAGFPAMCDSEIKKARALAKAATPDALAACEAERLARREKQHAGLVTAAQKMLEAARLMYEVGLDAGRLNQMIGIVAGSNSTVADTLRAELTAKPLAGEQLDFQSIETRYNGLRNRPTKTLLLEAFDEIPDGTPELRAMIETTADAMDAEDFNEAGRLARIDQLTVTKVVPDHVSISREGRSVTLKTHTFSELQEAIVGHDNSETTFNASLFNAKGQRLGAEWFQLNGVRFTRRCDAMIEAVNPKTGDIVKRAECEPLPKAKGAVPSLENGAMAFGPIKDF